MSNTQDSIRQARRLVDYFATQAEGAWAQRNGHGASAWASIAAEHAFGLHPGYFASRRLEGLLLQIASTVPTIDLPARWRPSGGDQRRVLHVLTTAYAAGGHARIVERWARRGAEQGDIHWAVLLNQGPQPIPDWLEQAITAGGGRLIDLREPDLIRRAALLRALWRSGAACAVVSTHPYDPVPLLAFGVEHGAPVYYMNAADHVFWLGAAIADLVIDIRPSGQSCSQQRRGVRRSELLPIPLVEPTTQTDRAVARSKFAAPADACILLTVASAYKYKPTPPWNLMQALEKVMSNQAHTHLVAAGPKEDPEWQPLRSRFPDRVHLLGEVANLEPLHRAADIYLDSFPFASLTATLEAGLNGLPLHLPLNPTAPLMSNDDPALIDVPHYAAFTDYVDALASLISLPDRWKPTGQAIASQIRDHHLGPQWMARADAIIRSSGQHTIILPNPAETEDGADLRWVEFQSNVRFLPTMGVGLYGFKEFRHGLKRSPRTRSALRLLFAYPRYASQPRLAARVAYEIMKN